MVGAWHQGLRAPLRAALAPGYLMPPFQDSDRTHRTKISSRDNLYRA